MRAIARPLRLMLVDDHTLFRESLCRLLESERGFEICGDFATAEDALAALRGGLEFDAGLIDYELGAASIGGDGLQLVRQIRGLLPEAGILMVTAGINLPDLLRAVMDLNVGIFLKTEPTAELMLAIQRTAKGERWVSSGVALALLSENQMQSAKQRQRPEHWNQRENLVLRGVLEGLSNKEIGARLDLTESSVKAVLQKLFEKTGVRSRSQLVRYAIEAQIAAK
jgi:DNA-binding NarL/FixJ family response regulator